MTLGPIRLENIGMFLIILSGCINVGLSVGYFLKDKGYEEVS
jgi:hypothetical protein